ncbi:hypothetical protein BH11CYA1_BH11CYA1_13450 [soil metagenome]
MQHQQQRQARIDIAFAVILFSLITFILAPPANVLYQVTDLPEFYIGAKLFVEGRTADIYDNAQFFALQQSLFPALGNRACPLYIAPFGLPFLLPFLVFPLSIAYVATKVAMIAFFLSGLYLLCRLYQLGSRWFMWLSAILPFSGPVWEAIRIEQLSPLLFLSLAGHLYFIDKQKPVLAAICLSPYMLKPHLVACLCCFHLGARRFKFVACFALIALALLGFTYLYCGAQAYTSYFDLLNVKIDGMSEATPTLRGQLLRFNIDGQLVTKVCSLVLATAFLAAIYFGHLLRHQSNRAVALGASLVAVPLGLVLNLHCYSYDLLLLLPGVLIALKNSLQAVRPNKKIALEALALYLPCLSFMLPIYALIHYQMTLQGFLVNYHFVFLFVITIYLIALGLRSNVYEKLA